MPLMSNERVAQVIQTSYPVTNIIPDSIWLLDGYDDRNYYLKGSPAGQKVTKEYVFKVMTENDPNYFDAITKLMYFITKEGFKVPLPVQPLNCKDAIFLKKSFLVQKELQDQDDTTYGGLLLNYLPGRPLSEVDRSPRLLYSIGASVGKLSTMLQKFSHPYLDTRYYVRDIKNFQDNWHCMKYADTAEDREYFESSLNTYAEYIQPRLTKFQTGVIHNDINEGNLLCTNNNPSELVGIIDISDAVSSYSVFDGAVFIAFMMMLECTNPLEYSEPAVSGYLSTFPLNEVEFDCLYYLVACQLAQCALHGLRSKHVFPDNPYRTKSLGASHTTMKILYNTPKEEVEKRWRSAQQKTALDFQE
ncbi:hydroxylysine kinase-like isoform X2 [Dysidea avara]